MFEIHADPVYDTQAIENLLDQAFGPDRRQKASYQFRTGVKDVPSLRFVALSRGQLLGTIRFWPVAIRETRDETPGETPDETLNKTPGETPALLLGPLGVLPGCQGMGVGAALMTRGMNAAREQGHQLVLLVGELDYYGRFGFAEARSRGITMPSEQDRRVLVRELQNDALHGVSGLVCSAVKAAAVTAA